MPVYKLTRFTVRADAQEAAERAMHDYASYVRRDLAGYTWTVSRDPANPTQHTVMTRADSPDVETRSAAAPGTVAFLAALTPLLSAPPAVQDCALVTSSDLAPRSRPHDRRRR